ncbi:phenylalanine--tRNA ligase subunit alpha, partial [Candidatus Peregrinibacteria bacterium]|nr:phenylalanine--tRNA ligase subunit alpha [Candidatus Peregrinibacteria bacterium]
MKQELQKILEQAKKDLKKVKTLDELKDLDVKYLGRKGLLTEKLRSIKDLPNEEKKDAGQLLNQTKKSLEHDLEARAKSLEKSVLEAQLSKEFFDTTLPGETKKIGHIHVLAQIQEEVEKIFGQMGYAVMDGPEIDSEYYNFEGINIPADHPARDMQDTFFIKDKHDPDHQRLVLRTHTSPVQARTIEKYGAPLRIISPGRVFRNEALDASHEHTFHQTEGMLIDKNISLGHLKGTMIEFLSRLFNKDVEVRFRPGYFPFVEPGLELDFSCLLCQGKGCRVCKHTGWVEFMGA